ncbi:MAG: HNH endonuclease [Lewinellaceae bacterium]|nr:HNH endonuclease [Lewinellaceae bacterium]
MRRRKLSQFERAFIKQRAAGCCEYCKFPFDFSHDAFHIEHIIPLQKKEAMSLKTRHLLATDAIPSNGYTSNGLTLNLERKSRFSIPAKQNGRCISLGAMTLLLYLA